MGWMDWVNSFRAGVGRVEGLAQQVAVGCQPLVWANVRPAIAEMGYHEARGYAQARALVVVRQQIRQTLGQHTRMSEPQRQELQQQVLDRVVTWVLGQAAQARKSDSRGRRSEPARRRAA